ncbi:precorrin-6A/cobalt-precorrin-6A reductase [Cellulosilyticum ruminicola]|uniref:precorrin-6A/cobalt-precorrin-6A reductase n=1 Tax=Cellulosilyticum ruminicola TaxID=425254 RepID=UPI0006CF2DFE|nr:precorrin-6A/cobalt-precorrin-6A reductase [Cellulosilyticum ruminicola]
MIWIIGGGPRSYQICSYLNVLKKSYKLTTITDYKRDMPLSYTSKALSKPLNQAEMEVFINKNEIHLVIDHSYEMGGGFSKLLIEVCGKYQVKYIRYEEPLLIDEIHKQYEKVQVIVDQSELKSYLKVCGRPILVVDNRKLRRMFKHIEDEVLWTSKDDIRLETFENKLIENQIQQVIASEDKNLLIYVEACRRLVIPLMLIKHNKLQYPIRCYDLLQLKEYLR